MSGFHLLRLSQDFSLPFKQKWTNRVRFSEQDNVENDPSDSAHTNHERNENVNTHDLNRKRWQSAIHKITLSQVFFLFLCCSVCSFCVSFFKLVLRMEQQADCLRTEVPSESTQRKWKSQRSNV